MTAYIPQHPVMTLLNEQEILELNAVKSYPRRKLTEVEKAIKDLQQVTTIGRGNMLRLDGTRDDLSMATQDILERLNKATNNFDLKMEVKAAVHNPDLMQALVRKYPYVEFFSVINGVTNVYQEMTLRNVGVERLHAAVLWLYNFQNFVLEIPKAGANNWFIGTPSTPYLRLRNAAAEQPEAYGLVLPELLQSKFDMLFRNSGHSDHPLSLIQEYNLHAIHGLWARFGLRRPSRVDGFEEKVYTINMSFDNVYRVGQKTMPVLVASSIDYPAIGIENIGVYRFVL